MVSDMVFLLLFMLASLWSVHLRPPLSNAVNPILGCWSLPSPSVQCPSNSLGFLKSSLRMGLSLPVWIQISRSFHPVYLPQVLTYHFWSCSISCLYFCSFLGQYRIQRLLGIVISSFVLIAVLQPALYHWKALSPVCTCPFQVISTPWSQSS